MSERNIDRKFCQYEAANKAQRTAVSLPDMAPQIQNRKYWVRQH